MPTKNQTKADLLIQLKAQNQIIQRLQVENQNLRAKNPVSQIKTATIISNQILNTTIENPSVAELVLNHILMVNQVQNLCMTTNQLHVIYGMSMSYLINHTPGDTFLIAYQEHPCKYSRYGFFQTDLIHDKHNMIFLNELVLENPGNDPFANQVNTPELDELIQMWSQQSFIDWIMQRMHPMIEQLDPSHLYAFTNDNIPANLLSHFWNYKLAQPIKQKRIGL